METVTLALNELNSVSVNLFGATVTSWICNGKERLFVRYITFLSHNP